MTDQFLVRAWVATMPQPVDLGPMSAENAQQLEGELLKGRKAVTRPLNIGGRMTIMAGHLVACAVLPVPQDAIVNGNIAADPVVNVSPPEEGHGSPQA